MLVTSVRVRVRVKITPVMMIMRIVKWVMKTDSSCGCG